MTEATPVPGSPSIAVQDAQLYLVFPFVRSRWLSDLAPLRKQMKRIRLSELNSTLQVPLNEKERPKISSKDATIWEDDDNFTLDRAYFHDFVQSVFGTKKPDDTRIDDSTIKSLKPLGLTSEARNLISGALGKRGNGLSVVLSNSAWKRLESVGFTPELIDTQSEQKGAFLPFDVENCHCLFFGTGVGMLLVEINIFRQAPKNASFPFEYLLELSNQLCRAAYWNSAQKGLKCFRSPKRKSQKKEQAAPAATNESQAETHNLRGLGPLCAALLGERVDQDVAPTKFIPIHWEKVPIFCGVKTDPFPTKDERDIACIRLARKETTAYVPNYEAVEDSFYYPFSYLTHTASIEGGVMMVEVDPDGQTPEYVENFVTNSTKRAYLPLMLWAMHEYLFLTELSKSASGWVDFRKTKEEDMIVLRSFRARIYNYRFHFRFSHASAISMHNDMFRLWRKTYDLGTILDEVDRDVAETDNNLESFYTARARSKQERSRLIFGLFLAVAGTVISIPDWINRRMSDIVPIDCGGRFSWLCWDFSLHYTIVGLFLLSSGALGLLLVALGTSWVLRRLRIRKIRKKFEI